MRFLNFPKMLSPVFARLAEGFDYFPQQNRILREKSSSEPAGNVWKPKIWSKNVDFSFFEKIRYLTLGGDIFGR